jgi:hypothetical protein
MTAGFTQAQRHGLDVWLLENDVVQVALQPAPGGKLVSLYDKRRGVEWLAPPVQPPLHELPYGSAFGDSPLYGWDEMMPTIVACPYPGPGDAVGAPLPDHGEVWTLPWKTAAGEDGVHMQVAGRALPYTLARTARLDDSGALLLDYSLRNEGSVPLIYLWAAHPQFLCEPGAEIVLPSHVTHVVNVLGLEWGPQWGPPGTPNPWPAKWVGESRVRLDQVGDISRRGGRKFYGLPDQGISWAGLWRPAVGAGLQMEWAGEPIAYLGVWVDEGAFYPGGAVVALEPSSAYYDNLAAAAATNRAPVLAPHAVHHWQVTVRTGASRPPFA